MHATRKTHIICQVTKEYGFVACSLNYSIIHRCILRGGFIRKITPKGGLIRMCQGAVS